MDAQNAVESTTTRPAAPDRRPLDIKKTSLDISSSPPIKLPSAPSQVHDDDGNSDAETVVLPGKDGYSPSKTRKMVNRVDHKQIDSSGPADNNGSNGDHRPLQRERDRDRDRERDRLRDADRIPRSRPGKGAVSAEAASSLVAKKKKSLQDRNGASLKDGSSGLSSAPASPPPQSHSRRLAERRSHGDSDSESTRPGSPKPSSRVRDRSREKVRPGENVVPHKRKVSMKPNSDDEGGPRKIRRQRLSSQADPSSTSGKHLPRDSKLSLGRQQHSDTKTPSSRPTHSHPSVPSRHRSTSPPRHSPIHRRSLSTTQFPSSNGPVQKKRRIPPPLSTNHHSDDSSGSGSPNPNLRTLTTPATADSVISPAKMAPHKKHLDAHGQTLLARACAKGEYEIAKARLMERPDDLNVADYAGNTPLQIASLQGHAQIVKLLIESGCALDCMNNDRDTPLLDAVDNGHLEVVRLLLDAGVNPRKTNINGEEPLARVTEDMDNAEEIRVALQEARNRPNAAWRRASEEHHGHDQSPQEPHPPERQYREARSHGPESPRRSPAALSHAALGRRAATSRATKTSNSQLYKPLDDKTLRDAALRGDEETVLRILQVKEGFNDPESMVGAARGGHETVMQYLLALGGCDPDPDPVLSLPKDANTPMLAAIGQGTLGIVKLLLDQSNFDPTRKFGGQTYYEVARDRAGPEWQQEEDILKKAYDDFKKSPRDTHKDKSPNRRVLSKEQRAARAEAKGEAPRTHKRKASSPTREHGRAKILPSKPGVAKEKRRAHSFSESDDQVSKRGPGRPRKDIPSIPVPTRDESPRLIQKTPAAKPKRQDTDHGANSSEGEATAAKPRRKLVSGRELKDERERERQRRSSMVSNNSTKEAASPREKDDGLEKVKIEAPSEKYHDRAKAIRRDDSKDRLSMSGEASGKRHRSSVTPPCHSSGDKEEGEAPVKRRRLDVEGKEKRQRSTNSSPEDRHRKPSTLRESSSTATKTPIRDPEKAARREAAKAAKLASKSNSSTEKLSEPKSTDVDMADSPAIKTENDSDSQSKRDLEKKRRAKIEALEARKRREEDQARQEEERKQREEEEKKQRDAEEARKQEEAQRQLEEEERKRKEIEERKRREEEAEEQKRREEKERLRLAEEERKRKEEEERRRKEEEERLKREEERKRREEEERRRCEEEEARRQQLLREAAEAERREAEEKERRIREEQERLRLAQEAEQRRIEAEQRRIREEQERLRIAKLPPLLRWFDACAEPKTREVASKFTTMQGVRYDTIVPGEANSTVSDDVRRELWVLNTHAAFLLGEKDLSLSKFPAWRRLPANHIAKSELMGVEGGTYALTAPSVRDLAKELPGYVETLNGSRGLKMAKDRGDAHKLFVAMDLFFVRVSDLMSAVGTMTHLRNLEIAVQYRELPLSEEMRSRRQLPLLWKNDSVWANRNHGSAPGAMLYMNGIFVGETRTGCLVKTSTTPFPDGPVPRRGFTSVRPDDPEYEQLCREQGLEHLLNNRLPNGTHHNATSPMSPRHLHTLTPVTPGTTEPTEAEVMPPTNMSTSVSGMGPEIAHRIPLPNGVPDLGH